MADKTGIEWTDATFNPWIGCTKVSPGCDHCYAEAQDARGRWDGGRTHWGAGVARYRTSASNWAQPLRWNKAAAKASVRRRVFCASLADVCDNEIPAIWREDLCDLIIATPHLDWQLLTKRIGNARPFFEPLWIDRGLDGWPRNVWLGASVVNQTEADRDIPKLLATPAAKRFLSCEPLLAPIDLHEVIPDPLSWNFAHGFDGLDWVIAGSESGPRARLCDIEWVRALKNQCVAAGVAFFYKQAAAARGRKIPTPELDGRKWIEFPS